MKNKQEQIKKIVCIVKNAIGNNGTYRSYFDYIEMDSNDVDHAAEESAEEIYKAGYRKAIEVIDEFVERLKELLTKHEHRSQTDGVPFYQMNAESFCDEIDDIAAEMLQEVEE